MSSSEILNPSEELDQLSLSELQSRKEGLENTLKEVRDQLKGIRRAIARKEGKIIESKGENPSYLCEGCGGYIEGEPDKEHLLTGEPSQKGGLKIRRSCVICGDDLKPLEKSVPA